MITGASSGIGNSLARRLAEKGNRLILIARRRELLQRLVQDLPDNEHLFYPCDVSDPDRVETICRHLQEQSVTIDAMILNAGLSGGFDVHEIDLDSFRYQVKVNFWGAVYFVKHLVPQMIKRKAGLIAVNGSLAGYRGVPKAAPYSAAKGALMNFIECLRIDLRRYHIQCTLISPGFVKTPMTDRNDFVMPFLIPVERAISHIIRGLEKGHCEICFPFPMCFAAKLGRILPNPLYAWMMQYGRRKKQQGFKE